MRLSLTIFALCVLVTGVTQAVPDAYAQDRTDSDNPFLTLGKIGPAAIPFQVWTTPSLDAPFKPGDRVTVHFKAEKPCYLVVANVAPSGDVQILFPFKEKDLVDNRMDADKEHILFGEGSGLKLAIHEKTPSTRLVFYVSPKPVDFVKIADNEIVMKVPAGGKDAQKALLAQMKKMAAQKEFNRQVIAIRIQKDQPEPPEAVTSAKGWKDQSETPEAVTGAAGRSETPAVK